MRTKTPKAAQAAVEFAPAIRRLYVHTKTVRGFSGYDYWDDEAAVLWPSYSGLISSAVSGAEGLHAPVLDIDFPVTVESDGNVTVLTIEAPARAWAIKSLGRTMARLGLVPNGQYERWRLMDSGFWRGEPVRLRIAAPVQVVESSPGRHHVFIERAMTVRQYRTLLRALVRAKVVERSWAFGTCAGYTCVRTPGARKRADLSGAEARLAAGTPQR